MKTRLFFVFLLIVIQSQAQKCHSDLKSIILTHRDESILIDSNERFIWIGTKTGLYFLKRNGKGKINAYVPGDGQSLEITSLACFSNGIVLAGTKKGLLKYDGYTFYLLTQKNSGLPENRIDSIITDPDGEPIICTSNHRLKIINGDRFIFYENKKDLLLVDTSKNDDE